MRDTDTDRDDPVLKAFFTACPRPTAQDIIDWVSRHPDRADDIREVAEIALSLDAQYDPDRIPSPALTERIMAASDGAFQEAWGLAQAERAEAATFRGIMADCGKGVPRLARDLDIGRAVLTDLVQGRIALPLPRRFAAALAAAASTTAAAIEAAAGRAATRPQMGRAKAQAAPAAHQRTFADIVRDDPTMTEQRKAYWLLEG